jgi:hypothetical protein
VLSVVCCVFGLLTTALLSGCAPNGADLRHELETGVRPGRCVKVPFVKQKPDRCGSTALAEVLGFWGAPNSGEERLAKEVFSAGLHGSLNLDLAPAVRRWGLVVRSGASDRDQLARAVLGGCPVVALVTLSPHIVGRRHYLVITGIDSGRGWLLADDGYRPDNVLSPGSFDDDWAASGRWALYCWLPDRPPEWASGEEELRGGLILEGQGRAEPALSAYRRAIAKDASLWEAHFNAGNVLAAGRRFAEAEASYRQALALVPVESDVLNNLAWTLLQENQSLAEAGELARRALRSAPPASDSAARAARTLEEILTALERPSGPEKVSPRP